MTVSPSRTLTLLLAGALLLCGAPGAAGGSAGDCTGQEDAVVADTVRRRLSLCQGRTLVREYPIAIGRGGAGKRKRGDEKTPLGDYPLGTPRKSERFGTFIPVGYPTEEQRSRGYSGGDIGVHGPDRRFAWLGAANTWTDWTQGCIAVATDGEIEEIALWVQGRKAVGIVIK